MDIAAFLVAERQAIVGEAEDVLTRLHEPHYESAGTAAVRQRLDILFDQLVAAVSSRDLSAIVAYAGAVAQERFEAGFDLAEVQAGFNALEAATWRRVLAALDPADYAEALGLVSTVFGAAKDALGRRYVSLATRAHAPSLDLTALFSGSA